MIPNNQGSQDDHIDVRHNFRQKFQDQCKREGICSLFKFRKNLVVHSFIVRINEISIDEYLQLKIEKFLEIYNKKVLPLNRRIQKVARLGNLPILTKDLIKNHLLICKSSIRYDIYTDIQYATERSTQIKDCIDNDYKVLRKAENEYTQMLLNKAFPNRQRQPSNPLDRLQNNSNPMLNFNHNTTTNDSDSDSDDDDDDDDTNVANDDDSDSDNGGDDSDMIKEEALKKLIALKTRSVKYGLEWHNTNTQIKIKCIGMLSKNK